MNLMFEEDGANYISLAHIVKPKFNTLSNSQRVARVFAKISCACSILLLFAVVAPLYLFNGIPDGIFKTAASPTIRIRYDGRIL